MKNINRLVYFLMILITLSFNASDCSSIKDLKGALTCLCTTLYDYVSIIAFLMINIASVVFALGNFFGAETRARANVWATSMLTGAIIGIVLIIIVPTFISAVLGYKTFNAESCSFN